MKVFYHPKYNINLGVFGYFHPFDGKKFAKVYREIKNLEGINFNAPDRSVRQDVIARFVDAPMVGHLSSKDYILGALEVPRIPLPFFIIDNRILQPMRWGVAGTLAATTEALKGHHTWNMAGGYHHASPGAAEGFCIYNDIGITLKELVNQNLIDESDKILIIDIDAHHGNGNALTFMQNKNISLLDIYNHDVYPTTQFTKDRLDVNIPLRFGTGGEEYLTKLENGLKQLAGDYKLAFVVAGTDVLASDPLGGLKLTLDECLTRDRMVMEKLVSLSTPAVFLGGGGYSQDSATAITQSLTSLHKM